MHDLPIAAMSLASRPEDQDRNLTKQKPRGEADNGHWITPPLLLVLCNSRYAAAGSPPSLCVCFGFALAAALNALNVLPSVRGHRSRRPLASRGRR